MTNHMPWDNGAIVDSFDQVFGFHVVNKTTKTRCGKRVPLSQANHKALITCDACRKDIEAEKDFAAISAQYIKDHNL